MRICKISTCNCPIETKKNDEGYAINNRQEYCDEHMKGNGGKTSKYSLYKRAKTRAKEKGREFSLSWEAYITAFPADNKCPVFGFELEQGDDGDMGRNNSPSIDRIDNDKGYTDDNIRIISKLANSMKQNATDEQLYAFAEWVLKDQGYAPLKLGTFSASDAPMTIGGTSVGSSSRNYNQTVTYA